MDPRGLSQRFGCEVQNWIFLVQKPVKCFFKYFWGASSYVKLSSAKIEVNLVSICSAKKKSRANTIPALNSIRLDQIRELDITGVIFCHTRFCKLFLNLLQLICSNLNKLFLMVMLKVCPIQHMQAALKKVGFSVLRCGLQRRRPSGLFEVILDIEMPYLNGYEVCLYLWTKIDNELPITMM